MNYSFFDLFAFSEILPIFPSYVNFIDKNEFTELWRENGLQMTFPGTLWGSEYMNQRDSYHHNTSLHLAYHFLSELFLCCCSFRMQTRHVLLQCIPGSEYCSMTYSKQDTFYLLFLNNCLQAPAELKNDNANDFKMKRHIQISLKLTATSENLTHGLKSQHTHMYA